MRHMVAHRKLGRTHTHRKALLRNLVRSLFTSGSGRIVTTVEKAKEARVGAEKMITLGKRETVHARGIAAKTLPSRAIIRTLFEDIAPKFADRKGGYTRILRLGPRPGDNAEMVYLELVGIAEAAQKAAKDKASAEAKPADKKADKAASKEGAASPSDEKSQRKAALKAKRDADKAAAREKRAQ